MSLIRPSGRGRARVEVQLGGRALARELVLGDAAGRRVRQLGHGLEVARHLERREQGGGHLADGRQVGRPGIQDGDEALDLLLGQLGRHADHRRLRHVGVRTERLLDLDRGDVLAAAADHLLPAADERVRPVGVPVHEIAGAQPALGTDNLGRLLGHAPVAPHHGRVSQLELSDLAVRHRPALRDDPSLVHRTEPRVLADGSEGPERPVPCGQIMPYGDSDSA